MRFRGLFICTRKFCQNFLVHIKSSAGIALRRLGIVSLERPAAGGESCEQDSFLSYRKLRFYTIKRLYRMRTRAERKKQYTQVS